MSDKKQIINVKDLVIRADNVYIEPNHHHDRDRGRDHNRDLGHGRKHDHDQDRRNDRDHDHDHDQGHESERNHDPFFGFFRGTRDEGESSEHRHNDIESSENREERRPFSWF